MSDDQEDGDYGISFRLYETIYRTRKQQISYLKETRNTMKYILRKGNVCTEEHKGFNCRIEELNQQITQLETEGDDK